MDKINLKIPQKNEKYVVKIVDYGSNGEGIAKIDSFTVFVPFALINEEVEILIVQAKKDFAFGKVVNIIKPSEHRIDAPCLYFQKCGGCQLQHMDYSQQLKYKTNFVQNCLKKYADINECINNCVPSNNIFGYRNKFSFPVEEVDGEVRVGMYRIASHKFVPINDCLLQQSAKPIISAFEEYANAYNIKAYNCQTKSGVKHLVCRIFDNNILLTVVSTQKLQNLKILHEKLQKYYKNVNICVNINKKDNNVILGDKDYIEFGDGFLQVCEYGLNYKINNHSFMQVNNQIKHKLYDAVLENIDESDVVIDAYSGAGVLSGIMAQKCKQVFGIEIVKPAVDSANKLVEENNIANLTNICGDCAEKLPKLVEKLNNFVVVLDPPRKGCDAKVLKALNISLPSKIIYVSCNPATLARDLNMLKENYNIKSVTPYDMFPQTANVETLVVLNRK